MPFSLKKRRRQAFAKPLGRFKLRKNKNHGNQLGTVDGLHYWTNDFRYILDQAEVLARAAAQDSGPNRHLPKWAKSVLQDRRKLEKAARKFQEWMMSDTRAIEHGGVIPNEGSVAGSVETWYQMLGPTNDAVDLIPFLARAVERLESDSGKREHKLLAGNMLEDIALRTNDAGQSYRYLERAINVYDSAVGKDPSDYLTREAIRRLFDCKHMLLRMDMTNGKLKREEFYADFEKLQIQSTNFLETILEIEEHHMGDGELLEWACLIFLRHRVWENKSAENYEIRDALIREDQAFYPWRVEYGDNPEWSFDVVVTNLKEKSPPVRLQLKVGVFEPGNERYRSYLPNVVRRVTSSIGGMELQHLVAKGLRVIKMTYQNDVRHEDFNQNAVDKIDRIFPTI